MDLSLLQRAAELGNAEAQYALAAALLTGQGMDKDLPRALELFRAAAQQNHAAAQCNLGVLYGQGLGVEKDTAMAKSFYEKSVEGGDPNGFFNLALLYAEGADVTRAAELAREAQRRGHREALAFLESLPGQDEYILCRLRHLHHRSVKLIQDLRASSREEMPLLMDLAKELEEMQCAEGRKESALTPEVTGASAAKFVLDAEIVD
eukprot:symbB.v1.2.003505.t1/scaffold197.1/size274157/12